ncbi:MAG TPA: TerC/Alx family metal homeostasis membrane protein [Phycisphaerae bacterium]|nr:TerC/Alx family metal homeostasis membrane protein [Phycisphaerae bacterium]
MTIWVWVGFVLLVLLMLAADLGVFNRRARVISASEALAWTGMWVAVSLGFTVLVYYLYEGHWAHIRLPTTDTLTGYHACLQFLTGYVLEKSLSVDNIFIIALIFTYFQVPAAYQHRTLFWGILGALVMRGAMIAGGSVLLSRFSWMVYVFGGLLMLTAVKMLIVRHDNLEPERNPLVKLARRVYPVSRTFEGERFFTRVDGRRAITPLFLVLLVVESTDVLFAVDSIPAIFAVTQDPFLVFTSNVFAILGLRSLYFALAALIGKFRYLKMSLVFVLAFVGVKMMLVHHHPIPTPVSLAVIGGMLSVGVLASVFGAKRDTAALAATLIDQTSDLAELTLRQARRIVILVVGTSLLIVGVAMIVLPGPAFVVLPAGLALLGTEFVWARRLIRRIRRQVGDARDSFRNMMK